MQKASLVQNLITLCLKSTEICYFLCKNKQKFNVDFHKSDISAFHSFPVGTAHKIVAADHFSGL